MRGSIQRFLVTWIGTMILAPLSVLAQSPELPGLALTNPLVRVAEAVVVTVELDFNGRPPTIRQALAEVLRRHEPDDGVGRTFAILDAWGETNANGTLRVSMHLSMEKPGTGALVFRRTGKVLWRQRIERGATALAAPKNLTILMADPAGRSVMLDGTKGATHVLDVPLHNSPLKVRDLWPDGAEREFTFLYSACGCPVKARVKRTGEATMRATELPLMFPDDPAVMRVIRALMRWPEER